MPSSEIDSAAIEGLEHTAGYTSKRGVSLVMAAEATAEQVRDGLAHSFTLRAWDPVAYPPAADVIGQQNPEEILRRDWIVMERGDGEVLIAAARIKDPEQIATITRELDLASPPAKASTTASARRTGMTCR